MKNCFISGAFNLVLLALLVAQTAVACDRESTVKAYTLFEPAGDTIRIPILSTMLSPAERANASSEDDVVAIFRDVLASYARQPNDGATRLIAATAAPFFSNGPGWRIRVNAVDERGAYVIVFQYRLHAGALEFLPMDAWLQLSTTD